MLLADAHTNPFSWRGCAHVYAGLTFPRRCLACGVRDEGPVPMPRPLAGGRAGYQLGAFPFAGVRDDDRASDADATCPKGHPYTLNHYVRNGGDVMSRTCWPCRNERRDAKLLEPCANGHTGQRYQSSNRGIKCRGCDSLRHRQARAASIARGYAEQTDA